MIDLHVHSARSDGSDTPTQLVQLAANAGCDSFALTDHDTVGGIPEAVTAGKGLGVRVISGVELSCHLGERSVHLLGYFVDTEDNDFIAFLEEQRKLRDRRNQVLCDKLAAIGVHIDMDAVLRESNGDAVGRPHFAAALVRNGEAASIQDAFARFLGEQAPTHVHRTGLHASDAIAAIHAAGGVTSWAHPLTGRAGGKTGFDSCLNALIKAGLDGLECYYSAYSQDEREHLAKVAQRNGIVATGGSDYHGTFKPTLSFAVGTGNLQVPDSCLTKLEALTAK